MFQEADRSPGVGGEGVTVCVIEAVLLSSKPQKLRVNDERAR